MMNKLYINGEWIEAIDKKAFDLINPATEEMISNIPSGNAKDADAAIDAARQAFPLWSRTTPYQRAEILKKAADLLRENRDVIAKDMVLESGEPLAEARGEWTVAANLFEWYAEECK